jgi:hypothetical protein
MSERLSGMSIVRTIDQTKQTVVLTCAGKQLAPEMDLNNLTQLLSLPK